MFRSLECRICGVSINNIECPNCHKTTYNVINCSFCGYPIPDEAVCGKCVTEMNLYCQKNDDEILDDIIDMNVPPVGLYFKGWSRVCQVRARNRDEVPREIWAQICRKRGYEFYSDSTDYDGSAEHIFDEINYDEHTATLYLRFYTG